MVLKVWMVAENGSLSRESVIALSGKVIGGSEDVALVASVASPCCCATAFAGRSVLTGGSGGGASVVGVTVWNGRVLDWPIAMRYWESES